MVWVPQKETGRADRGRHDPLRSLQVCLVAVRAVAADAGARVVDGRRNLTAKEDGSECNRRTDDREDQRVFGGRRTGLIAQHVDELGHENLPLSGAKSPKELGVPHDCRLVSNSSTM